jgi:FkbM family methyltransferase
MGKRAMSRRFSLDLVEVCLLAAFVLFVVTLTIQYRQQVLPHPEARPLRALYGESRYSSHAEEWIIRDFFKNRRAGFFVDVGAGDYRTHSNTFYLDTELGWSGIAIDALGDFATGYTEHRPRTRFRQFFVSDTSDETAVLYMVRSDTLVSSGNREFTARHGDIANSLTVPTVTLNELLDHEGVQQIDFLSMDIELWEPKALAGFDIARFRPELVCIEAHPEVRQQILDYFTRHGYVVDGRYLRADVWNLYFRPVGDHR